MGGVYMRGNPVTLLERFSAVDPLTGEARPDDPSDVVFIVRDPDGVETTYTFGTDLNVSHPDLGVFLCALPADLPTGAYAWRCEGGGDLEAVGEGDFTILRSEVLSPADPTVPQSGPCSGWIDGGYVADWDTTLSVGSGSYLLDTIAAVASQLVFELSARLYPGVCRRKVRPCRQACGHFGSSLGLGPWYWTSTWLGGIGGGWRNESGDTCGCGSESYIRLAGYPVRRILEVKLDGVVLDPAVDYRLDGRRNLIRLADTTQTPPLDRSWPRCQNLALADTEPGTFCVDEETEILTENGWKHHDEITPGDRVYTISPETSEGRFEPLLAVNTFAPAERKMLSIETANFSVLATRDHRWLVWQNNNGRGRYEWRTSARLNTRSGIPRSAARADAPSPSYSDAFVESVAWYWNEGSYDPRQGRIVILQSERANPQHVAAIRSSLGRAFPGGWSESMRPEGMVEFRLKARARDAILAVTEGRKAPQVSFLLALSVEQLLLFIERCLDGDGTRRKNGPQRVWYQQDEEALRRFEMICALAGIATNTYRAKETISNFGVRHRRGSVALLQAAHAWPIGAAKASGYCEDDERRRRPAAHADFVSHRGLVWCPTTPSGTWLARRRGTVYFTGNSVLYEWGQEPPELGRLAAAQLAVELWRASPSNQGECRLPAKVTRTVRQGVTMERITPLASVLRDGATGLPLLDAFIAQENPQGARRRSLVWSPDVQPFGRQVGQDEYGY